MATSPVATGTLNFKFVHVARGYRTVRLQLQLRRGQEEAEEEGATAELVGVSNCTFLDGGDFLDFHLGVQENQVTLTAPRGAMGEVRAPLVTTAPGYRAP